MKAPIENADFGKTADDYLRFRAGFPDSLFERLATFGIGKPGQQVADIGTGTGTLGRGFAKRGSTVTGVDPAESMLDAARAVDARDGLNSAYIVGRAESTGLPANQYDVVSVGQAWHWFDAAAASEEIRRILASKGSLVVAYYDWLPITGNVVRRTEELIEQYNPAWKGGNMTGIHPSVFRDLGENGFSNIESFTYDEPASYTHEGWRGRIRASAGVAATLDQQRVEAFDQELATLLAEDFPVGNDSASLIVPHRVFALVANR